MIFCCSNIYRVSVYPFSSSSLYLKQGYVLFSCPTCIPVIRFTWGGVSLPSAIESAVSLRNWFFSPHNSYPGWYFLPDSPSFEFEFDVLPNSIATDTFYISFNKPFSKKQFYNDSSLYVLKPYCSDDAFPLYTEDSFISAFNLKK